MFVHKESLFLNTGNTSPSWCDSCEVITNMALPWFQLRQSVPRETWLLGWFRCRIRIQHIICLFMLVIKLYIKRTWTQGIQDHIQCIRMGLLVRDVCLMPTAQSGLRSIHCGPTDIHTVSLIRSENTCAYKIICPLRKVGNFYGGADTWL